MPRYIDAEFAEKEITSLVAEYENRMPEWSPDDMLTSGKDTAMKYGYKADGAEKALEIVNKIPTADVQEVKHGHWIECDYKKLEHGFIETYSNAGYCCSVCRTAFEKKKMTYRQFCPKCGARMDGGKKR